MPLYEADLDGLVSMSTTTFEAEKWKERGDIQRLLKDRIEIIEEGLLVLSDEFSGWSDSSRRIDLLCLDKKANLVVIELKRGEDGGHMELQAVRYAAMISAMTFANAAEALARSRDRMAPDTEAAQGDILNHLGWTVPIEDKFAKTVRIILASADFGKELTTAVLWLRGFKLDIRCVRLRPYRLGNGKLIMEVQQLIPLPEIAEFQTKLEEKKAAETKERGDRETRIGQFFVQLAQRAAARTNLHEGRAPNTGTGALLTSIGKAGVNLAYVTATDRSRAELLIFRKDAQAMLHQLQEDQEEIAAEVGVSLEWKYKEVVRQCRVFHQVEGGYNSPEAEWPRIHDELITAMMKLDTAFRPRLQRFV